MSAEKSLDALRREIDAIDGEIHHLLMERCRVSERIADLKGNKGVFLRPGREAEVLRRLVGNHQGPFPKRVLARIWREIFSAFVSMQGPFSVAVFGGENEYGYWNLARDQFGTFTPMTSHQSAQRVIDEVMQGRASVGVLPLPRPLAEDPDPWWRYLVTASEDAPRFAVRLPFTGLGQGRGGPLEAIAISRLQQEKTGLDRSLFAIELAEDIALGRLTGILAQRSLPVTYVAAWGDKQASLWLYLVEVDEFLMLDDDRLEGLSTAIGRSFRRLVPMGGYALPFSDSDLATPSPQQANGK